MSLAICRGLLALLLMAGAALAIDDQVEFTPPPIEVPDGFTIELVAGPPLVKFPMMAAFDERGRLFIAESDGQNLGKDALLEQTPRFVRMIEDSDGDGKFDESTIYADGMVMPEGALCHNGTFFIMSAPYLWRLDDTDGNGVADHREQLLGEMDLIGNANQHGPYLTPAGRLLFSGGTFGYNLVPNDGGPAIKGNWASVFSCKTDGSDVRVESHAGINPVEVEFTDEGDMLGTCAIFDRVGGRCDSLVHWVHGGSYAERLRVPNLKQTGRYLPAAIRWGQVAPAGLVRMRGSHFGDDYRGNIFTCLFNTHELLRVRIERIGATFRGEHEVFLRSPSADFHPADILEDADGSLLLIDTGAWLTMGCPRSKNGMPGGFGGIYRIRKTDGPTPDDPRGLRFDWKNASIRELTALLDDPRPVVRDRTISRLVEHGNDAVPQLAEALSAGELQLRRNAVWTLARIGDSAQAALCEALSDRDPSVRQSAAHALGVMRASAAVTGLMKLVIDDELPVRREAATALGLIGDAMAVGAVFDSLRTAKDEFLEHALVYALIEIGDVAAIQPGLTEENPRVQRAALIALDQIDENSLAQESVAGLLAATDSELQRATLEVIARHPTWAEEIVALLRESLAASEISSTQRVIISGAVAAFSENETVQALVAKTLGRSETDGETLQTLLEAIGRMERTSLPPMWLDPLAGLLAHPDENVKRQLLAGLRPFDTKPLDRPLREAARNDKQPNAVRLAALNLVARYDAELNDAELQLLIAQLAVDAAPAERLAAANALSSANLTPAQLTSLLTVIKQAGPLELAALLRAFETAVRRERIQDDAARKMGLSLVASLAVAPGLDSLSPIRVQAVFAGFPAEVVAAAKKRFPDAAAANVDQLVELGLLEAQVEEGNPESGQQLFFSNRLACAGCHRISGKGGMVGPDLSQIAKVRSTRQLAEAVLLPSASLANGFESYVVATQSGQTLTGLIRRETASAVHLVSTDGSEIRVPRSEIEDIRPSDVSIMPQGLDKQISHDQLRDLLAFLRTLK
jgi:putative membrane-bound dehydrogenase-like protein